MGAFTADDLVHEPWPGDDTEEQIYFVSTAGVAHERLARLLEAAASDAYAREVWAGGERVLALLARIPSDARAVLDATEIGYMDEPASFRATLTHRASTFASLRETWDVDVFHRMLSAAAPGIFRGDLVADSVRARRSEQVERAREAFFRIAYGVVDSRSDAAIAVWLREGPTEPALRSAKEEAEALLIELRSRGILEPIDRERVLRELELHTRFRNAKALAAALFRLVRDGHARPIIIIVTWLRWLDELVAARKVAPGFFDEARIAAAIDALGT
jgi:hypothetical protein